MGYIWVSLIVVSIVVAIIKDTGSYSGNHW